MWFNLMWLSILAIIWNYTQKILLTVIIAPINIHKNRPHRTMLWMKIRKSQYFLFCYYTEIEIIGVDTIPASSIFSHESIAITRGEWPALQVCLCVAVNKPKFNSHLFHLGKKNQMVWKQIQIMIFFWFYLFKIYGKDIFHFTENTLNAYMLHRNNSNRTERICHNHNYYRIGKYRHMIFTCPA